MSGTILILGSGPNIGVAVAKRFASGGYKVALAARSVSEGISDVSGFLNIKADLSDPHAVRHTFEATTQALGPPNIVVYNVARRLVTPLDNPLALPLTEIDQSRKAGLDGAYVAAQQALQVWKSLPANTPTAFIYTGNALNQIAIPGVLPFALGKVAAAMLIEYAANAYGPHGYRFYFADERQKDGRPAALQRDGLVHADMYWALAHEVKQSKWLVTFVKGEGRRAFEGVDFEGGTRASYDEKFGRV